MNNLSFATLREANAARLPLFKNSRGETAHSREDGSDWSPAQWLQAMFGELGELALLRLQYDSGDIGMHEYRDKVRKELADVQTYLDLAARRMLDEVDRDTLREKGPSPAMELVQVIAWLGSYANERKKFERGDHDRDTFISHRENLSNGVYDALASLLADDNAAFIRPHPSDLVVVVSPFGVDLGRATEEKFNEVSKRVGCDVVIFNDRVRREAP